MSDQDATLDEFTEVESKKSKQELGPPTEITGLPADWKAVRLSDVAEGTEGAFVDGPFGSNLKAEEMSEDGYARIIQLQNIRESEFVDTNHKYVSYNKFKQLERHGAQPGDLAIAKMSEPVARACLLPEIEDQYLVVADCIKLTVDESKHNSLFVMLALNSRPVWKQAFARSRGSTRKRINLTQLKEVQIPSPSLEEQRKIASVLHTIDQAIHNTEKIIEQTGRVKSGLLQKFYATGYYDHQNWQDIDVQDAYMMTRTDEVPAEWDIRRPDEISEVKTGHTPSTSVEEYWDGEIPWIDIHDLTQLEGTVITSTDDTITREGLENSGAKLLSKETLVLCRTGAIGNTAITGREMATDQDQVTFECDQDVVLPRYLMYLFEYATPQLERLSAGSTHDKIQLHFFSDLGIPLPDTKEQEKIVDVLDSVDSTLLSNKRQLTNLRNLKKGLMQDILSGEVRTHDKDIEVINDVLQYG